MWESTFDSYYLSTERIYDEDRRKKARDNWSNAFTEAAGADAVLATTDESQIGEYAQSKGHKVVAAEKCGVTEVAAVNNVRTVSKVLDKNEQLGREVFEATEAALEGVDTVWNWLTDLNLTQGKEKPDVKCFRSIMDGQAELNGYYIPGGTTVYINESNASGGVHKRLLQTCLEEVGHYITGATDMSRDFQSFFMKAIVELKWKGE